MRDVYAVALDLIRRAKASGALADHEALAQELRESNKPYGFEQFHSPVDTGEWNARLVSALPWGIVPGTFGRIRVRRYHEWPGGPGHEIVLFDGRPVWADGRLVNDEERDQYAASRREIRAYHLERERASSLEKARVDRALAAGRPVLWIAGQCGGVVSVDGIVWVSAHGAWRRAGVRAPEMVDDDVEMVDEGPVTIELGAVRAASSIEPSPHEATSLQCERALLPRSEAPRWA